MARRRDSTPGTPATTALSRAGVTFDAHPCPHDPAAASYGLEAAAHSQGVESTTVVRVATFAVARIRASSSSRSPGARTLALRM